MKIGLAYYNPIEINWNYWVWNCLEKKFLLKKTKLKKTNTETSQIDLIQNRIQLFQTRTDIKRSRDLCSISLIWKNWVRLSKSSLLSYRTKHWKNYLFKTNVWFVEVLTTLSYSVSSFAGVCLQIVFGLIGVYLLDLSFGALGITQLRLCCRIFQKEPFEWPRRSRIFFINT